MTEQVGLRARSWRRRCRTARRGMSIQSLEGASQAYFDDMLQSEITIMTSAIPADTSGGGIEQRFERRRQHLQRRGVSWLQQWQLAERTPATSCAPLRAASTARTRSSTFTCSPDRWADHQARQTVVPGRGRHQSSDEDRTDVPVTIRPPTASHQLILDTYGKGRRASRGRLAEAQARDLRSAMVEAQGQGLRRGAGSASLPVPRSEARASHGRERPVDVAVDQAAFCSRLAIRGLCSTGWERRCLASSSRANAAVDASRRERPTQRQVDDECALHRGKCWSRLHHRGLEQIQRQDNTRHVFQGVMSYVTGSHSFKFGYNHEIGPDGRMGNTHMAISIRTTMREPAP